LLSSNKFDNSFSWLIFFLFKISFAFETRSKKMNICSETSERTTYCAPHFSMEFFKCNCFPIKLFSLHIFIVCTISVATLTMLHLLFYNFHHLNVLFENLVTFMHAFFSRSSSKVDCKFQFETWLFFTLSF
jgi:hypothetical protein